jgi:hypothetical protein
VYDKLEAMAVLAGLLDLPVREDSSPSLYSLACAVRDRVCTLQAKVDDLEAQLKRYMPVTTAFTK